jgi:hypothetical protein
MTEHDERSQRLDERLARLPAEIPPARDLWPEIATRLETGDGRLAPPARKRALRPLVAVAATVVVAVLAASLYRGGEAPSTGVVPAGVPVPMASTFGPGHQLGSGYLAARAGLTEDLERSLAALSPETRAIVLENLETIRRSAAEINTALGKDPANVLLQQQLLAAYQDELSVLANLQRVTERLPTRNEI